MNKWRYHQYCQKYPIVSLSQNIWFILAIILYCFSTSYYLHGGSTVTSLCTRGVIYVPVNYELPLFYVNGHHQMLLSCAIPNAYYTLMCVMWWGWAICRVYTWMWVLCVDWRLPHRTVTVDSRTRLSYGCLSDYSFRDSDIKPYSFCVPFLINDRNTIWFSDSMFQSPTNGLPRFEVSGVLKKQCLGTAYCIRKDTQWLHSNWH